MHPNFLKGAAAFLAVAATVAVVYRLSNRNEPEQEAPKDVGKTLVKAAVAPDQAAKLEIMRELAKKGGKKSAETRRAKKQAVQTVANGL